MESGSSGSFQCSSGGGGVGGGVDDEHDSRDESMSAFMNSHKQTPSFFQPSSHHNSQNLDASFFLQNTNLHRQYDNNNNNEQMGWSRGFIRSSETNCVNFGNFSSTTSAASSLPSSSSQPLSGTQRGGWMINESSFSASLLNSGRGRGGEESINNPSTMVAQPPPPPPNVGGTTKDTNPKKRTRASRRAPTTVLTTDTTNFRQMVQEFTGIPSPPFSSHPGGSTFARRLDPFFSTGGHQYDHLSSLYPLRPPAKISPPSSLLVPSSSSSSSPSSLLSSSLIMNGIYNTTINNASISNSTFGLPQHYKQHHLHSIQNQLLNFQPSVQSRPHYYQGSSSMNIPLSLDELRNFVNSQRSSQEVETQSSLRDDLRGRNLNTEAQDGQHQLERTFDGNNN